MINMNGIIRKEIKKILKEKYKNYSLSNKYNLNFLKKYFD